MQKFPYLNKVWSTLIYYIRRQELFPATFGFPLPGSGSEAGVEKMGRWDI